MNRGVLVPEWSKGAVLRTADCGRVGSNPTEDIEHLRARASVAARGIFSRPFTPLFIY